MIAFQVKKTLQLTIQICIAQCAGVPLMRAHTQSTENTSASLLAQVVFVHMTCSFFMSGEFIGRAEFALKDSLLCQAKISHFLIQNSHATGFIIDKML